MQVITLFACRLLMAFVSCFVWLMGSNAVICLMCKSCVDSSPRRIHNQAIVVCICKNTILESRNCESIPDPGLAPALGCDCPPNPLPRISPGYLEMALTLMRDIAKPRSKAKPASGH